MNESLAEWLPSWAQQAPLYLPTWKWIAIFLAVFAGFFFKRTAKFVLRKIMNWTTDERFLWQNRILTALERPTGLFIASGFWFISLQLLQLDATALKVASTLVQITFSIAIVWGCYNLVDVFHGFLIFLAEKTETTLDDHLIPMMAKPLRIFVLVVGVLVSIQNLGFNVLSVLAGLGLGGLAFALAAKDTCANVFGSIMILVDRPFTIGDWIVAGDVEGTVEEIGFRSTRLRTFYNSVISIPNAGLANLNIDNMGQRQYRRVNTTLGITYDTSPEKLEAFMEGIKNIIRANETTRKDYFHVCFKGYGDFSLNIMVYFFLEVPDWSQELIERQNIYLEILRLSKELGIEFAFPTSTLHMETFPEKKPTREARILEDTLLKEIPKDFGPQGKAAKPGGVGFFTPPYREES